MRVLGLGSWFWLISLTLILFAGALQLMLGIASGPATVVTVIAAAGLMLHWKARFNARPVPSV